MAYMDIQPSSLPTSTIVLLHGKNFCGATWEDTARRLLAHNYRVVIPDQIGFCKSSKPPAYQFSLQQLASNTKSLLDALDIPQAKILGHSMGGMLATRFALMFPDATSHLILTNPIGLEDWKALGVPWRSLDLLYADELKTNYTSVRKYQQATYYVNTWKPEYDVWVNMLVSLYRSGEEGIAFAYDMALTTDAVLTQPVVYEFGLVKAKTLVLIGTKDNTAIGECSGLLLQDAIADVKQAKRGVRQKCRRSWETTQFWGRKQRGRSQGRNWLSSRTWVMHRTSRTVRGTMQRF